MSKLLASGFITVFALLYFSMEFMNYSDSTDLSYYLIPLGFILVLLYIFHYQIDWWWAKRRPPALDPRGIKLLEHNLPFYNILSTEKKAKFNERLSLYLIAHTFIAQGSEKEDMVPEDVKIMAAMHGIMLSLDKEDYLMHPFEHIVFYKHPFPSPSYQFLHASEINTEDGALIFSVEQMMLGVVKPKAHYNIALHEYAQAFIHIYPNENWPILNDESWVDLENISGLKTSYLNNLFGAAISGPLPVAINYFFSFPEKFEEVLPEIYRELKVVFKI